MTAGQVDAHMAIACHNWPPQVLENEISGAAEAHQGNAEKRLPGRSWIGQDMKVIHGS